MQIVGTNSSGNMTTQAQVLLSQGGTGLNLTFTVSNADQVLQVNTAGSALTLGVVPSNYSSKIYSFYRFG